MPIVYVSFAGIGRVPKLVLTGEYFEAIQDFFRVSVLDHVYAMGIVLTLSSYLYHMSPLFPSLLQLPLVGRVDLILAKITALIGIACLAMSHYG